MNLKLKWISLLTFKKKLSAHKTEFILLLLILGVAVFFRFYKLEELFPFGWDQERDAQVMWHMLKEGRLILIGPRAVGPDAFFLGPLWFYLLAPFYFIFGMDPIGAAVFTAFSGIITTLAIYLVIIRYFFSTKEAIFGGLLWATQLDRVAWNPILIPLFSLIMLYLLIKIVGGKNKLIPLAFLVVGLGLHIHFQAVFFFVPLILALYFYYKRTSLIPIKDLVIGAVLLLLTFAPLLLFDLRHEFINIKSFLKFFSVSPASHFQLSEVVYRINVAFSTLIRGISIPELSFIPISSGLIIFLLSTIGILVSSLNKQNKTMLLSFIFIPPLAFSFYKGVLSEYYFVLSTVPIIIGISIVLKKVYDLSYLGKSIVAILVLFLLGIRFTDLLSAQDLTSLYYKKQAVQYILNQKLDPIFNVSYSVPINAEAGIGYLFKFYGKEPQNIPEGHLWTIVIPANGENVPPLVTFGDIGVIRR